MTLGDQPPQLEPIRIHESLEEQFDALLKEIMELEMSTESVPSTPKTDPADDIAEYYFEHTETLLQRNGTVARRLDRLSVAMHDLQCKWETSVQTLD
jgi:hypothetical protein